MIWYTIKPVCIMISVIWYTIKPVCIMTSYDLVYHKTCVYHDITIFCDLVVRLLR